MYGGGCNNSSSSGDDKPPVDNTDNPDNPDDPGTGGDETENIIVNVNVAFKNCNADIYADGKFVLPKAETKKNEDGKVEDKDPAEINLNFADPFDASAYEKLTFDVDAETRNDSGPTFLLLGDGDWNPVISKWGAMGVYSDNGKYNYTVDLSELDKDKTKDDLKTLKAITIVATSKYAFTVYDNFKFEGSGGTATLKLNVTE